MKNKDKPQQYTKAVKRNVSSQQVLKTLMLLLEGNYTMTELVEKLNQQENEPIFNNSVVSKYINTCRYIGIKIPKIHNRYFVASMPFGMELSSQELDLLNELQITARDFFSGKQNKIFDKFIESLSKYSNKQIFKVERKNVHLIMEKFDKAVQENRKIRLLFRVKAVLECIPIAITEKKGKTAFYVFFDGKAHTISASRIAGIEILDKKFAPTEYKGQKILFKLTGGLAQRYSTRNNESIIMNNLPESITVSNSGENREELFARLMRYDSSCEVLFPKEYRKIMKTRINNTLSNYGE